jgi:hypothetical protein
MTIVIFKESTLIRFCKCNLQPYYRHTRAKKIKNFLSLRMIHFLGKLHSILCNVPRSTIEVAMPPSASQNDKILVIKIFRKNK